MKRFIDTSLIFNQQAGHVLLDGTTGKLLIVAEDDSPRTIDALGFLAHVLNTLYANGDQSLTMRSGKLHVRERDEFLEIDLTAIHTLCRHKSLIDERLHLADKVFNSYDFGDGVRILEHESWDTADPNDLTKIVHVESSQGAESDESSGRLSFHVLFSPGGRLMQAYALNMATSSPLGVPTPSDHKISEAESFAECARTEKSVPGVCATLQATQHALTNAMQYARKLELVVRTLARAQISDDPASTLTDLSSRARNALRP